MKAIFCAAILCLFAVGCTAGYKQASDGQTYLKSGIFGNDAARPVQPQQQQQPMQYPVAE